MLWFVVPISWCSSKRDLSLRFSYGGTQSMTHQESGCLQKKKKKKDVGPSAERWATPLKWVYKKNKKNVFSSLSFGLNHYLVVVLLHFSILSICHCSWVVMERHRSVMSLFVSDLFIIHPLHLLPPILFLVLLQFTKTRLHKKQFPLNHRHCGMKIFLSY